MDQESIQKCETASFLLGVAYTAISSAQDHLIQGRDKEALSVINEAKKFLTEKINKHFYKSEEKANESV